MSLLKRNKFVFISSLFLLSGCATTSYRVLFQDDGGAEISVTPDRVLLECEDLYDADIKGLYGFMMHVLDDKDRVLTIVQGNTLDQDSCEKRIKAIGRILREGNDIYIAGTGDLKRPKESTTRVYSFPGKGSFKENGGTLGFVAVSNESGLCYDAYGGLEEKPCPPEPFPFWKKK